MKKYILILTIALLAACKNESTPEIKTIDTTPSKKAKTEVAAPANVTFKDKEIQKAYDLYIDIKTALVNTNAVQTAADAADFASVLEGYEGAESIVQTALKMNSTSDVAVQRELFSLLNRDFTELVKSNIATGQVYEQYCPMAFDFKGDVWLSNSKEIRNPYFGSQMLKCGEVKQVYTLVK